LITYPRETAIKNSNKPASKNISIVSKFIGLC
jgi:hypothetical protein